MDYISNIDLKALAENPKYVAAAATLAGVPILYLLSSLFRPSHPPVPPGPKPHFLLGNLPDFPQNRWVETFTGWQKKYGDLIYMRVMGRDFMIMNGFYDARELLVKRGQIYSGRPQDAMDQKVQGWTWNVVSVNPSPFHTEVREIFKRAIGQQEVAVYDNMIEEESRSLVESLRNFDGDPWHLIHSTTGAIVIKITYGGSVYRSIGKGLDDMNRETLDLVTKNAVKFWLVNFIPILHYLPDWLPLAFKKVGREGTALQRKMRFWAWEETVKHYKAGIAEQSIALEYLERGEQLDTARDGLGMMYSAGVDNTASTILVFLSLMLLHPDVQRKVHTELDRELGPGVQPTFDDRPNLPYLDGAWRESKRMHPTTPLGIPHVSQEQDIYKGWFIPKGAVFFQNISFMCRDARLYPDPDTFKPERWLESHNPTAKSLPDVDDMIFGFGRRVCPGQWLADRTAFVFVAALMKAYEVVPCTGGSIPKKDFEYSDSVISRPIGFRCKLKARAKA